MNNYEFCAQWVSDQKLPSTIRILDYGCGGGQIVKLLHESGFNAYGSDVFYEVGDYSELIEKELFENGTFKRITNNSIPFDSASFDIVINNQVIEHVEDLDAVLSEIHRVLKPGGKVLSLFPDKSVWREGLCGIPFLHWFPKKSKTRVYYAALIRALGFGHHKAGKNILQWSQDFYEWLDRWTHYRSEKEISSAYSKYFFKIQHIENHWLCLKPTNLACFTNLAPVLIQKLFVRKLCGMVFVAQKSS